MTYLQVSMTYLQVIETYLQNQSTEPTYLGICFQDRSQRHVT